MCRLNIIPRLAFTLAPPAPLILKCVISALVFATIFHTHPVPAHCHMSAWLISSHLAVLCFVISCHFPPDVKVHSETLSCSHQLGLTRQKTFSHAAPVDRENRSTVLASAARVVPAVLLVMDPSPTAIAKLGARAVLGCRVGSGAPPPRANLVAMETKKVGQSSSFWCFGDRVPTDSDSEPN